MSLPAALRRTTRYKRSSSIRDAEYAESVLQGAGLRVTHARVAVLVALRHGRSWASHGDIAESLAEPLDRVTLYRTLDTLVEAGLVSRSVGEDRIGRFTLAASGVAGGGPDSPQASHEQHAHFHCADCGKVFCLDIKVPRRANVPDGFAVQGVDLNVRGCCDACSNAASRR